MSIDKYKVIIPCAGIGSRLNGLTNNLNKTLLTIENKPIISYIIEKFHKSIPIIIPVGHKGHLIKQFCSLAYPDRDITFIDIENYKDHGSGLGLTLLSSKHLLQCPFIFCSNDTIVIEEIQAPTYNWAGYDTVNNNELYRSLLFENNRIVKFLDKNEKDNSYAYIGLCGINDFEKFWQLMEDGILFGSISMGETFALKEMATSIAPNKFTWFDTGAIDGLNNARKFFKKKNSPIILDKNNEAIWFIDGKVIKYFDDETIVSNRLKRHKLISKNLPQLEQSTKNMYSYKYYNGDILSKCIDKKIFQKLLEFYLKKFSDIEKFSHVDLKERAKEFYLNKTKNRIKFYLNNRNIKDCENTINEIKVDTVENLLSKLDVDNLINSVPCRFHGDFHFENILLTNSKEMEFCFLDWRQDFAGTIECGDIYYDFAKLLHGLIISHEVIEKKLFKIEIIDDETINFDYLRSNLYIDLEKMFYDFLELNNFDIKKTRILCSLIFLNISPLHEKTYGDFLFYLGKYMLNDLTLIKEEKY